jgi:hypothetical protein
MTTSAKRSNCARARAAHHQPVTGARAGTTPFTHTATHEPARATMLAAMSGESAYSAIEPLTSPMSRQCRRTIHQSSIVPKKWKWPALKPVPSQRSSARVPNATAPTRRLVRPTTAAAATTRAVAAAS